MAKFKKLYSGEELEKRANIQERYSSADLKEWLKTLYDFKPGCKVLDLGCGNGKDLLYFSAYIAKGFGIDNSENLIHKAKEKKLKGKVTNIEFIYADCNEFLQEKADYDIIYSNFAFYYFDITKVAKNISLMLNSQGSIYIGGSPDDNAPELTSLVNKLLDKNEVPETYGEGFSDVKKYSELFKKYFRFVDFHRFTNVIRFPAIEYFMQYLENTTLAQRLTFKKSAFFLKESKNILQKGNNLNLTKVVDTLRASNKQR